MSILITGGAGFVGSHLIPLLLKQRDERIVCLDNFNHSYSVERKWANLAPFDRHSRVTICEGDIRDAGLVEQLFAEERIRYVIHLAAHAGVRRSVDEPHEYLDNNVNGTLTLLEQCRRQRLERVVIASSSTVYGKQAQVPFVEDAPLGTAASPYGATKKATELLAQTYFELHGVPTVCVRPFSAVGARMRPDLGLSIFARTMLAGQPLPLFGDGSIRRDFTHVYDICRGMAAALDARGILGECFNLGNDQPISICEMIGMLESELGCAAQIKRLPANPADLPATCADLTKSRRMLGYEPQIAVSQAVREFCGWFRQEGVYTSHLPVTQPSTLPFPERAASPALPFRRAA